MTTNSENCPQCGAPLPANAPAGLCPRCVMAMNMATQTEFTGEVHPHGTKVLKTAPSPEELAAKFPQLEILELLGRGGMGAVYKARQKQLDRIVALKILPPGIGDDPAFAERFSREAKALAKLNHPNIVTLYEFGRADGLFFFLMEYVDGVNLRQLLDTGRVASREALAIVPQICDALQFAHDHGIVHRDIKPENILMDRRGRVKVADFGLAKLVGTDRGSVSRSASQGENVEEISGAASEGEAAAGHRPALHELTDAGKIMGTPQYMAPEQKEKPLEVDHRADIYALGVVFYQMLTGELPGKRIEAPSKKVQIDVRLDEIVLRALEKNPEHRYEHASVMKTDVENISSSVETPVTHQPQPKGNWLQRELVDKKTAARWTQLILFATALLLFAMGMWKLTQFDLKPHELFFGVLLVCILTFSAVALGFLARPASLVATAPPSDPPSKAMDILFPALNPAEKRIRVAVIAILLMASAWFGMQRLLRSDDLSRPNQLPASVSTSPKPFSFGPVIERFIPVEGELSPGVHALNFESGKIMPSPDPNPEKVTAENFNDAAEAFEKWLTDEADIAAEVLTSGKMRLFGFAWCEFAEVKAEMWHQPTPEAILGHLSNPGLRMEAATPYLEKIGDTFLLRTKRGVQGILQVTSLSDSPRGIGIRYKLVQNGPANANVAKSNAAFGFVIERVLPDPDNGAGKGNRETLNLRTGERFSALDEAPKEQGGRLRALAASEGDLFAEHDDFVGKRWAFTTAGLKLSDFLNRQWDNATSADVDEALKVPTALQRTEHFGATLYLLPDGLLPMTLAFETRNGERGLLQITALNDNPRTVTIRYKLVQPESENELTGNTSADVVRSNAVYSPPDFETFFPDDAEGGRELDALWKSSDKDSRSDQEILQTVRHGLRRTKEHRTLILRWLGNRYIWNKDPQNAEAIEIMYNAADWHGPNADPYGTRHYAVYFGLSVVQPKTPAILHALADLCMVVDDPNDLDRVAWGVENQQADFLTYLKSYHASESDSVREKASLVEQIIKGEIKAFAWATEKARQHATEKFSNQLPTIKETLATGSSEKRRETLTLIARERLMLIMDDTFVSAYARCADAMERHIRSEVARQAGERWIWSAEKQNQEAIDLMLKLSQDEDRDVRYNAVYFGLSTVRDKSEKVVRRLLEMAFADRERNPYGLFGRIVWGLKADRESVKRLLDEYLKSSDPRQANAAREVYEAFTGNVSGHESQKEKTITLTEFPPVIVNTVPVSGTREVEPGIAEIRVRFSKEMTDGSWSWSAAWPDSAPEIIGEPRYEADHRTCVINVKLESARTYAFWLNSEKFQNFTDLAGRAAVPYLLIFQTKQK